MIATITEKNFLATKKILESVSPLIFKGNASDVYKIRANLEEIGLEVDIYPKFNW